jgi:tetratricopeptide (TPR) repeat protein
VPDHPRIEELRRRVEKDPASIAFAQLGEEYRRAGEFEEAIRVCRTGLAQHPGYLSARVTLGRALLETQQYEEAQAELEEVLRSAPDNLAAIRALAEIHQRSGDAGVAAATPEPVAPAPQVNLPDAVLDLAFGRSDDQFARALESLDAMPADTFAAEPFTTPRPDPPPEPAAQADPALAELEEWLATILADRDRRARSGS